MTKKIRCK